MEVKSIHCHPCGRVDGWFLLELRVGKLVEMDETETDGVIKGVGDDAVAARNGVVLLADGMVAQPAARPVRHRATSSV